MMYLHSVYDLPGNAEELLYDLLQERGPQVNISHRRLPTFAEHQAFVRSHPYVAWYLIVAGDGYAGATYLSKGDEVGVFIFASHRNCGYAEQGVRLLMEAHPRPRFLANINPANDNSIRLFARLGFTHIQNTYELRA